MRAYPMEINKLTDTAVRNAKPGAKDYRLSDGAGLYLVVKTNGSKLWRWSFEFHGKEKLLSYGQYPIVTLAKAREAHQEARQQKASGVDPTEAKKQAQKIKDKKEAEARQKKTFEEVARDWFKTWAKGQSERYADTVRYRLEGDIFPALGSKAIDSIETPDIVKAVKSIEKRGAEDLARRDLQKIKQIYRYAISTGEIKLDPAAGIVPRDILASHEVKNFARIEKEHLPELLKDIELYRGNQLTRLAMKLMALTFLRTNALIIAEWKEFDFNSKRWNVPKEHMKGQKCPHIIPLARQTIEVLNLLKTLSGESKYLFPGQGPKNQTMSNGTICNALKTMGYDGKMTGHGFRGVASTILHECGHSHIHIELQLAHTKRDKVSGAYDWAKYLDARANMMQDWADLLETTLRTGEFRITKPTY